MSSLWYFILVWVGWRKVLRKIKALLCNFLWLGLVNTTRSRVSWDDYVLLKKVGGLSLASPKDVMRALISKSIIQTLLPAQSNLQLLFKYSIVQLQPSYHGSWGPSSL